jgi:cytochrome c-type biogenesis protein CcmH
MLFWGIAGLVVAGSLLAMLAPLLRGAGDAGRRASYDMQVYRDQLREIDRDVGRGVVTAAEAEAVRVEVSRKLLATADAEAREAEGAGAPRRISLAAGLAVGLAALALTGLLYIRVGAPGLGDQPLAARIAQAAEERANRPAQEEVEAAVAANAPPPAAAAVPEEEAALVDRLARLLEDRPDDLEGHRLLARSLASLGRFPEAWRAQERVVTLLGPRATDEDYVMLAEMMIIAANGYVSPEAEVALTRALGIEPGNPPGRYYSGLSLLQGGRPDLAYRLWEGLLREGPPEAPWVQAIAAEIDAVAAMVGLPPPDFGPAVAPPPPIFQAPEAEQQAMIEGMVASLGQRLATEGGPPEDWAQLIRSLGVLGRIGEAAAIWSEAREVYADNPAALATLEDAARTARLLQ